MAWLSLVRVTLTQSLSLRASVSSSIKLNIHTCIKLHERCCAMRLFYVGLAILSSIRIISAASHSSSDHADLRSSRPDQRITAFASVPISNGLHTSEWPSEVQTEFGAQVKPSSVNRPDPSSTSTILTKQPHQSRHLQLCDVTDNLNHSKHSWFISPLTRRRSLSVPGDRARMHAAMQKYASGHTISVAFVGGSITSGFASTAAAPNYVDWARIILHKVLGDKRMVVQNCGVSATGSSFMSVCHRRFIPSNADIIFLEYASEFYEFCCLSSLVNDNNQL